MMKNGYGHWPRAALGFCVLQNGGNDLDTANGLKLAEKLLQQPEES